jgi:preprotein translocase subunit SecY
MNLLLLEAVTMVATITANRRMIFFILFTLVLVCLFTFLAVLFLDTDSMCKFVRSFVCLLLFMSFASKPVTEMLSNRSHTCD